MSATTFRVIVLLSLVLGIASGLSEILMVKWLPEDLQAYRAKVDQAPTDAKLLAVGFVGMSVGILALISSFGLMAFWRPPRIIYTITNVLAFPMLLFIGPNVSPAVAAFLGSISIFLGGIVWALIYFSPLKERFDDPGEPLAP